MYAHLLLFYTICLLMYFNIKIFVYGDQAKNILLAFLADLN